MEQPSQEAIARVTSETVITIILFLGGLMANIPLAVIYLRSKHIRSITDKFLFNLLFADCLSLVAFLPSILFDLILFEWTAVTGRVSNTSEAYPQEILPISENALAVGSTWSWAFLSGLASASILASLEIAVERYLAVVTPLHYHKLLTKNKILIISIIGVFISIASGIASVFNPFTFDLRGNSLWAIYTLAHAFLLFLLPITLMVFIYGRICLEARRQKARMMTQRVEPFFLKFPRTYKQGKECTLNSKGKKNFLPLFVRLKFLDRFISQRLDRSARVAIMAILVSILCWSPFYATQIRHALTQLFFNQEPLSKEKNEWSWEMTYPLIFASLHPLLTPIFYSYRYKRLRLELVRMISPSQTTQQCSLIPSALNSPAIKSPLPPPIEKNESDSKAILTDINFNNKIPKLPPSHFTQSTFSYHQGSTNEYSPTAADKKSQQRGWHETNVSFNLTESVSLQSSRSLYKCNEEEEFDSSTRQSSLNENYQNSLLNFWTNFSSRWKRQRESIISTSSVITLISSRRNSKIHPISNV